MRAGGTPIPPFASPLFSSLLFRYPQFLPSLLAVAWGSQRPFDSGVRVPEPFQQQQQQQKSSPSCPHCCAAPSLLSAPASVSLPASRIRTEHGPEFGSALQRDLMEELPPPLGGSPLPQMPDSPLPALQLGSGLRRWLGEGFFPGCNFSLLHTICFERCLEALHPQLTAGAGECAGCQPREAPAPDPSSLGEITAN